MVWIITEAEVGRQQTGSRYVCVLCKLGSFSCIRINAISMKQMAALWWPPGLSCTLDPSLERKRRGDGKKD